MKKVFFVFALAVLGSAMIFARGAQEPAAAEPTEPSAPEEVTLKVISRSWAGTLLDWAGAELDKRHPETNITLDYSLYEYNECRTQLGIRLSRQEPIDVVIVDNIWMGEFKDMLMPLDPSDIGIYDEWLPSYKALMEKYAPAGKTLGLYSNSDCRLIFWNKKLLSDLGIDDVRIRTWDDVKRYATMVKEREDQLPDGVMPVGFMAGNTEHTNSRWYSYLWAAGGDILNEDETEAVVNSEAGVQALEFYGWFLENGMADPNDVVSPANGALYDQAFINGRFAISLANGSWLGSSTTRDVGMSREDYGATFDATLIPAPQGGSRGTSVAGGYLWSVTNYAEHPDLATELITIINGPEGYGEEGTGKIGIPTVKSAASQIDSLPHADQIKEALQHVRFRPTIPEYPQIADVIRNTIQKYVQNYDTPGSAKSLLDAAAKDIDAILAN